MEHSQLNRDMASELAGEPSNEAADLSFSDHLYFLRSSALRIILCRERCGEAGTLLQYPELP